ncbi:MAG: hypothetical protein M0Z82_04410 [Actinomycetota bacterium]|nr:hypothetical protein [Actinomycetota bacterium]
MAARSSTSRLAVAGDDERVPAAEQAPSGTWRTGARSKTSPRWSSTLPAAVAAGARVPRRPTWRR